MHTCGYKGQAYFSQDRLDMLLWTRARGQDQERQSRLRLDTRNIRGSQQAVFKQEGEIGAGNTEEHRSDGAVALDACSRTRSGTAVSFAFRHPKHSRVSTSCI